MPLAKRPFHSKEFMYSFSSKYKIHTKYDIKGSTVDRAAKQKEKEKDSPTYKDNDLISDGRTICIGSESKKEFMNKLQNDVNVYFHFILFIS